MKKILSTFILVCFIALLCKAQFSEAYINITPQNGLASSETYVITKDSSGYLWIGTDRGLNKFDGKNFTTYTTKDGLGTDFVDKIFINPYNNQIWVRCLDEKLYYLYNNTFYSAPFNKALKSIFERSYNNDIITDVFFEKDKPKYIYTLRNGRLTVNEANLAIGNTTNIYLNKVDENKKLSSTLYSNFKQQINCQFLNYKFSYKNTSVFFKQGVCTINSESYYAFFGNHLFLVKNGIIVQHKEFDDFIITIFIDAQQQLWIVPFSQKGVYLFPTNQFPTNKNGKLFFTGYSITSITQDFEKGYWYCTHDNGLIYLPNLNTQKIDVPINNSDFEIMQKITSGNDKIFVGTNKERILVYNKKWDGSTFSKKNIQYTLRQSNSNLQKQVPTNFNSLYYYPQDKTLYAAKPHTFKHSSQNESLIKITSVALNYGKLNDTLDFLCRENGVYIINNNNKKNTIVKGDKRVFTAVQDNEGKVWVGQLNGLFVIENDKILAAPKVYIPNRINQLKKLNNGNLVAATLGKGLYIFNKDEGSFISLGNDTKCNMVNDLLVVKDTVFAATQNGIVWFTLKDSMNLYHIGPKTGYNFYDTKSISYSNGVLYILSQNKLYEVDFKKHSGAITNIPTYINAVIVNDSIQLKNFANFQLQTNQKRIKIIFNAISFKNGTNIEYMYRLLKENSTDTTWKITSSNYLEYTSLNYGNYIFEVKSINENNMPSSIIASATFSIAQPFFTKWFFLAALFFLVIATMYCINNIRISRIKKQNEIAEQQLKYEQQALAAQINPHFIFNSLNSIQSFILKKDERNTLKYLTKFSRLMRLSLDNSRAKWVLPQSEIDLIKVYLELELLRFNNKFEYTIDIAPELNTQNFLVAPMLVQPFIENAIKHGVNNLIDKKGIINIKATLVHPNKDVLIQIDDNGIGRNKAMALNDELTKNHLSAGVDITINRIKLLSLECGKTFYFNIIDKPNNNGTTIEFYLPHKINPEFKYE